MAAFNQPLESISSAPVIDRLRALVRLQGLTELDLRLAELSDRIGPSFDALVTELDSIARGDGLAERGARHLLDLEGKFLRPLTLFLAARTGDARRETTTDLAVAVELVHSATLLHDDVVDLGEVRRGHSTSRLVYGNAASIFAGDFLLIEGLRRIRRAGLADLLDEMLEVIDRMIWAEAVQLESRGALLLDLDRYLEIIRGKTAALFAWAATAGARAAGHSPASAARFGDYGAHLGIAFQIVDDLLDVVGGAGKDIFADLREGKSTYPLIWALERDPALERFIRERLAEGTALVSADRCRVLESVTATGAIAACRSLANEHTERAIEALANTAVIDPTAVDTLGALATAALHRDL
jgi:octaprenyl-diphosphate synthase